MKIEKGRCQVGATVNKELWTRLRALSIMQHKTTGQVLDDCIRLYFEHMDKSKAVQATRKLT